MFAPVNSRLFAEDEVAPKPKSRGVVPHKMTYEEPDLGSSKPALNRADGGQSRELSPDAYQSTKHNDPNDLNPSKGSFQDGWHRIEYPNGVYEGHIKDNKRHGQGKYTWHGGNWYEGDWADDLKHGTGKFTWVSGDTYEGEYFEDNRQGAGIKAYSNGDKYEVAAAYSRVSGPTATNTGAARTPQKTETSTPACSRTTRKRGSASRSGSLAPATKATGCKTRCTAKAPSSGHRETSTRATTDTACGKEREPNSGPRAPSTP